MKALLVENIHSEATKLLTGRNFDVVTGTSSLSEDELIAALQGVDVVGIRSNTKITRRVLEQSDSLTAIGAFCIGTNQIDLVAAAEHGVAVFNAPYSNTRSVVELAIAEIIAMARRLTVKNSLLHKGLWDKTAEGAREVRGRVLGIVGYGNIGAQLSIVAEALGLRVIYYDLVDKLALGNARGVETLDELLERSDIVSLHVDGRSENTGFFGAEEFAKMKQGSLFLNLCRGMVVDYAALRDALLSGHIVGAAIDVFPSEPKSAGTPFISELQGMDNVILTPHIGGSTQEAQIDIGRFVAAKLADYTDFGTTVMSVNLPEVSVKSHKNTHRVVHLHHNVPGVLARLNSALAQYDMNIGFQTLATKGSLGYVVTDVVGEAISGLVEELSNLDETIRVRVL